MDGVLMFLCFLCIPVFFVSLVMLVVRLITRRKPWKPCAKAAVLSVIGFFVSAGVGNYLDNAQKKQNALSANPPAAVADSAVDVDNPVHIVRLPYKNLGVRFVLRRNVAYEATACSSPAPAPTPSPVPAAAPVLESKPAESTASAEPEVNTKLIRAYFNALLNEPKFKGGIVSIEPRTVDGVVLAWNIIDVVVPDAWYYLKDFQKERVCKNIGDFVRSAAVAGGASDSIDGTSVHFYDVAGEEVAKSKIFGGYKVLR